MSHDVQLDADHFEQQRLRPADASKSRLRPISPRIRPPILTPNIQKGLLVRAQVGWVGEDFQFETKRSLKARDRRRLHDGGMFSPRSVSVEMVSICGGLLANNQRQTANQPVHMLILEHRQLTLRTTRLEARTFDLPVLEISRNWMPIKRPQTIWIS